MSIKATMRLSEPRNADATISITMPLRDWRQLFDQLPNDWPSWRVSAIIGKVLSQAEAQFTEVQEYTD